MNMVKLGNHGPTTVLLRRDIDSVAPHDGSFLAHGVCQASAGPASGADISEDYVSWRGLELSVLRVSQRCDLTIYVQNDHPAPNTCNRCF